MDDIRYSLSRAKKKTKQTNGEQTQTGWNRTSRIPGGVRDSADAFGPLKSVAGGLCFILENCERTMANKEALESLAPRVQALAELLCAPVSEDDVKEKERRKKLERNCEMFIEIWPHWNNKGRISEQRTLVQCQLTHDQNVRLTRSGKDLGGRVAEASVNREVVK